MRSKLAWAVPALFLVLGPGCGSGPVDSSKDPAAQGAIQERNDRIDRLKAEAAKKGRPGARPNR